MKNGNLLLLLSSIMCTNTVYAERLRVGWAEVDITPSKTVRLHGQNYERICTPEMHHDPITATVLALESESGQEQAVLISMDLCSVPHGFTGRLRRALTARLSDLDTGKVFMNATHTHTAPFAFGSKELEGGMSGEEYAAFLEERLIEATVRSWNGRGYGKIARAKGTAAVGFCRIVVFQDGSARMYGNPFTPNFKEMESRPDHDLNILYFWNEQGDLTGVVVNLACPAQVVEGKRELSADFWHEVRKQLRAEFSDSLKILAQSGAAGDMSPRDLQNSKLSNAYNRDWPGLEYNGSMISQAVIREYDGAREAMSGSVEFLHRVKHLELARKERWHDAGELPVDVHVVRIGDAVLATNPFELYIDYGYQIKKASPAAQTFIVQLTGWNGEADMWHGAGNPPMARYLPTAKAVKGGAYGAGVGHGPVDPAGGKELVDGTVEAMNALWGGF